MTARAALRRGGDDGFVLVAALWLLAALAVLASSYAAYSLETAAERALPVERLKAEAALRAGVELAAFRVLAPPLAARPPSGSFTVDVGGFRVDVSFRTETARVDLNSAPKDLLAGLFAALGATRESAAAHAAAVLAWRRRSAANSVDDEAAKYRDAGLGYGPKHAPFDDVRELGLVRGVSRELAARAASYATVYSGRAEIDAGEADPVVLSALPGLGPDQLPAVRKARAAGVDRRGILKALGDAAQYATVDPGESYRVVVLARPVHGLGARAEAVVRPSDGPTTPFDVLSWSEQFGGGA